MNVVHFRVHCDKNYLIPTCTDYCIDTDDSTGHYRCNYDTGKRECYSGWYGDRCSVECNARNDTFGHYKCDQSTGMKICLAGWRDVSSNCTKCGYLMIIFFILLQVILNISKGFSKC